MTDGRLVEYAQSDPVSLNDDLSQIEACMLGILATTPGVEDPKFGVGSNKPGMTFPTLEYRCHGRPIGFGIAKAHDGEYDYYTFSAALSGLGRQLEWEHAAARFASDLGTKCGAIVFVMF